MLRRGFDFASGGSIRETPVELKPYCYMCRVLERQIKEAQEAAENQVIDLLLKHSLTPCSTLAPASLAPTVDTYFGQKQPLLLVQSLTQCQAHIF